MILYKIRENRKFESFEELKNQIQKDKDFAKNQVDTVMTFGTFDIFHE
jgi:FAD synthase